jgi:hypothetical protein
MDGYWMEYAEESKRELAVVADRAALDWLTSTAKWRELIRAPICELIGAFQRFLGRLRSLKSSGSFV